MSYRNARLLAAVHHIECKARIPDVCEGGNGEPAHSNQVRHGKGFGNKADDVFVAAMCRSCHREIDQGKRLSKDDRRNIWQVAHELTLIELFKNGLVRVV